MAPEKRQSDPSLEDRLFREFYGFSFFSAVHLLERLFPEKKPLGETLTPAEEVVRFAAKTGFAFPPSDISKLEHADRQKPVEMEVAFMGLIGPSGVLPHWYNELALERAREKDFSLTAFFDIFHHRLISLFYLAWKKHQFVMGYRPGAGDRFSNYLLALIGLATPGLAGATGLPAEALVFYSGLLSRPVASAPAIEAAVGYLSGSKVEIEQFVERLIPLSPEDRTQLGLSNAGLGVDAVCGESVWENQSKFRIIMGPMDYKHFQCLMPTGKLLPAIFSAVRYMVGIESEFEIRLVLQREDIPGCTLGAPGPDSPRLGWSTWLKTPETVLPQDQYVSFEAPLS
ncbi:MAG: type VI secretion system baseplate subunit TssG [Pseudomonadota bacterium]